MTAFGDLVTSDHRGLYIDLPIESISKPHQPDVNQHFQRTLKSSCPRSVRKYKKYLKKEITKREITNRINKLSIIVQTRKLNKMEEKELNNIDACITKIMLDAEKKTSQYQHNSLWSPELHIALKTFTIWTLIKTQLTTHVSQHSQIKHIQDALEEPINIQWRSPSEIFHNISKARKQLKLIRRNDKEARKHHLLNRASAANLENRKQDEKTILNLQRIEQTIMMWRTINYLTRTEDESSSQTIDIPEDSSIKWNDIKYHKGLIFKTISDPEQIDKYYAERNTHHLNQAQGSAFTIEPLNRL